MRNSKRRGNNKIMNLHLNITQDIGHGVMIMFICFMLVLFAVLIDLYTGVQAARKLKEKIRSHLLRHTIAKVISYLTVVFFGIFIDILGLCFPWYAIPYCCVFVTLAVILIEGKSVIENHTKAKNPAAHVPDALLELAKKIKSCDNIEEAVELAERLHKSENLKD